MITLNTNLKNGATSQYTNFDFNSMVRFGDKILGASASGLFNLAGNTDNNIPINAYFSPLTTDLGVNNPKRLRYVYLGYEAAGNLSLSVKIDDGVARSYNINSNSSGQQRKRITIGRDGQGRYFEFTFSNLGGCDFSVDSVDVLSLVRNSGIS